MNTKSLIFDALMLCAVPSSSCQHILLWYLSHADGAEALLVLQQLAGLRGPGDQEAASLCFRPGSEGGARPCAAESCRYSDALMCSRPSGPRPHGVPVTDREEDDALFEKLSGEQWRLECLIHLLAQLHDHDLPGSFFLLLLQVRATGTHQYTLHVPSELQEGLVLFMETMTLADLGSFRS